MLRERHSWNQCQRGNKDYARFQQFHGGLHLNFPPSEDVIWKIHDSALRSPRQSATSRASNLTEFTSEVVSFASGECQQIVKGSTCSEIRRAGIRNGSMDEMSLASHRSRRKL